jgi:hypothetical protein
LEKGMMVLVGATHASPLQLLADFGFVIPEIPKGLSGIHCKCFKLVMDSRFRGNDRMDNHRIRRGLMLLVFLKMRRIRRHYNC